MRRFLWIVLFTLSGEMKVDAMSGEIVKMRRND